MAAGAYHEHRSFCSDIKRRRSLRGPREAQYDRKRSWSGYQFEDPNNNEGGKEMKGLLALLQMVCAGLGIWWHSLRTDHCRRNWTRESRRIGRHAQCGQEI